MRILFYASNGYGLGHLMRTLGIARALQKLEPSARILFLTNSEAAHLAWKEGFPTLKLTSHLPDTEEEPYRIVLREVNRGAVRSAVTVFDPAVIAIDYFPLGQMDELTPIRDHGSKKALISRETNPAYENAELRKKKIEEICDLVIVPHRHDEGATVPAVSMPIHYVGPILIRSRDEAMSREQARQALGLPATGFLVYVGFGGGGRRDIDPVRAWILAQTRHFPDWTFAFASPPLFRGEPLGPSTPNVMEFAYAPLAECWQAFDLAISSLSFNSTMELLHHGIPAVFVELPEKADDWGRRARMIANAGAGLVVRRGDTAGLNAALGRMSEPARRAMSRAGAALVPENGAERAARLLIDLAAQ